MKSPFRRGNRFASRNMGYVDAVRLPRSHRSVTTGHQDTAVVLDRLEWGSDHLDLAIPLVVEVSYIDGEYVATHDATKVFGHGATPADALSDFNSAFLTSYHIVSKFGPGNFSWAPIMHHVRGYIGQQA